MAPLFFYNQSLISKPLRLRCFIAGSQREKTVSRKVSNMLILSIKSTYLMVRATAQDNGVVFLFENKHRAIVASMAHLDVTTVLCSKFKNADYNRRGLRDTDTR